jgi:hypothetical protein
MQFTKLMSDKSTVLYDFEYKNHIFTFFPFQNLDVS